jgi:hypothetical protein
MTDKKLKAPPIKAPIEDHKKHAEEVLADEKYKVKPEDFPDTDEANP